jgi:ribosomal protein S6
MHECCVASARAVTTKLKVMHQRSSCCQNGLEPAVYWHSLCSSGTTLFIWPALVCNIALCHQLYVRVMPLYDLLCLVRPALERQELHQLIKRSCNTVLGAKGFITKVTYNGETTLAYTIKKTHGHYPEASSSSADLGLALQARTARAHIAAPRRCLLSATGLSGCFMTQTACTNRHVVVKAR